MEMKRRGFLGAMIAAAFAPTLTLGETTAPIVQEVLAAVQEPVIAKMTSGVWHHFAFTHSKAGVKVYLDGALVDDVEGISFQKEEHSIVLKVENKTLLEIAPRNTVYSKSRFVISAPSPLEDEFTFETRIRPGVEGDLNKLANTRVDNGFTYVKKVAEDEWVIEGTGFV